MDGSLTTIQRIPALVEPVNATGTPVPIDGLPTAVSEDPAVCTVSDVRAGSAPNTFEFDILGLAPGSTRVLVTADARVGSGVVEIGAEPIDVTVTADEAVGLTITLGAPVPK